MLHFVSATRWASSAGYVADVADALLTGLILLPRLSILPFGIGIFLSVVGTRLPDLAIPVDRVKVAKLRWNRYSLTCDGRFFRSEP